MQCVGRQYVFMNKRTSVNIPINFESVFCGKDDNGVLQGTNGKFLFLGQNSVAHIVARFHYDLYDNGGTAADLGYVWEASRVVPSDGALLINSWN